MKDNVIGVDLNVNQEYIKSCIENIVKASMIEALDMKNEISKQVVETILNQKVDKNGKPSTSSWDEETLINYQLRKVITETTTDEIKAIIEEKKPQIREMIRKELSKKSTLEGFVSSFFTNIEQTLASSYRTKIDIKFEKESEN